jgi:suppressor for copper-sensitivity B
MIGARIASLAFAPAAALTLLASAATAATAGASDWFVTDQGQVRLVAASPVLAGDKAVELGLEFRLKPHWKIYWRSPGDAGYPPRLDWAGSENLAAASLDWPEPQRFSVLGLETVGYVGDVVLPIRAELKQPGAAASLRVAVDYLTCEEICIPYQTTLALDLPAAADVASNGAFFGALIARFAAEVPGDGKAAGLALAGATLRPGSPATLELRVRSDRPLIAPDAFIEGAKDLVFGAPVTQSGAASDETLLRLPAFGNEAAAIGRPLEVTLVDGGRAMTGRVVPEAGAAAHPLGAMLAMLGLALLGGLILNVMPCVLPVLSLKFIGLIEHGDQSGTAVRRGFLATAAGILVSFLALAATMIALTKAGIAVGWGVQFQEPLFLAAMVVLLTLFAANLWGFFEMPVPRPVAELAARAGGRTVLGNFATGAFATLLATPCSAPFLGTAVGFALAAGPLEILGIFLALGVGFAAPYLVVAALPRLAALLPRPGHWMVAVRRLLGVALAGTALWLVSVIAVETGPGALVIALAMAVAVAALAFLRTPWARGAVVAAALIAAMLPAALPRQPEAPVKDAFWRPFDPVALSQLVHDGHVVFVDVTADWCLTCKVNERLVLERAPVRDRLAAPGIVAMRADWTRPDAAIAEYLRRFGRYGIPFNAVYGPGAPAGVALPEILSAERVEAALRQAAAAPDGRG